MNKKLDYHNSTWAAVAFQDHLVALKRQKRSLANSTSLKWEKQHATNLKLQQSLRKIITKNCPKSDYCDETTFADLEYNTNLELNEKFKASLSLAEKLGLAEKTVRSLNEDEWKTVKELYKSRTGGLPSDCPICQEPIGTAKQVLLSCSHSFHLQCLESFEKFTVKAATTPVKFSFCCPMCRTPHYLKRLIFDNLVCCRRLAAIKIQACYRMYRARSAYAKYRASHPPKHPLLLKKHIASKMASLTLKLDQKSRETRRGMDSKLSLLKQQIEQQAALTNAIIQKFKTTAIVNLLELDSLHGTLWKELWLKATEKHNQKDCPICLRPLFTKLDAGVKSSNLSLLDCSHVFHTLCITCYEAHSSENAIINMLDLPSSQDTLVAIDQCKPNCPICRHSYKRINL